MLHLPSLDLKFDVATSSSSANSKKALIKRVTPAATRSKLSKDGLVVQSKDLLRHLKSWDKCNRATRMRVLETFLLHNKNTTGSQLESKYGETAGLLLARVLAWLRCVYPSGHSCTQLLSTISIFLNASNGFLAQITQAGGITVLSDMLTVNALSVVDLELVVQLLCDIVCARPDCIQAFLSHQSVTAIITNQAVQSQSSRTRKLSEKLLHHLALSATATPSLLRDLLPLLANEDTVEATLLAARTLRANFSVDGAELSTNELVSSAELALALLKSPHFEVQHEGCELLVELCNFKGGRHVVAVRLLSTFTPALANHLANLTAHVVDILFAKSPSGSTIQMRRCMLPPEYQRHSLAAKLLARLTMDFCEDPITRDVVVQESTLLGLLMLMADKDSCNARIHGLSALLSLLEHAPEVKELIRHRMGELFLAELTSRGEHFFNDGTLA